MPAHEQPEPAIPATQPGTAPGLSSPRNDRRCPPPAKTLRRFQLLRPATGEGRLITHPEDPFDTSLLAGVRTEEVTARVVLHLERYAEYLTATYGHERLPGGAPGRVRLAGPVPLENRIQQR